MLLGMMSLLISVIKATTRLSSQHLSLAIIMWSKAIEQDLQFMSLHEVALFCSRKIKPAKVHFLQRTKRDSI